MRTPGPVCVLRVAVAVVVFAVAAPTSAAADEWFTVPVSGGSGGSAGFVAASDDSVLFASPDALTEDDADDGGSDLYRRRGPDLELVTGAVGGYQLRGVSGDVRTVVVQTSETLSDEDTDDGQTDFYALDGGAPQLVTGTDPALEPEFSFPFPSFVVNVSRDGGTVAFATDERLVPGDTRPRQDVYVWTGGVPVLATPGGSGSGAVNVRRGGMRADGRYVLLDTTVKLLPADTDSAVDLYRYDTQAGELVLATPGTAQNVDFQFFSADGARIVFTSSESLVGADGDGGMRDVYVTTPSGPPVLASSGGDGSYDASFQRASGDASWIYFTTDEALDPAADTDSEVNDIYRRTPAGAIELVSTGPAETLTYFSSAVSGVSGDGATAYFWTAQDLAAGDDDSGSTDSYSQTSGGATTRLSVGAQNDDALEDATFAGASADGDRTFFVTRAQMTSDDGDSTEDAYSRAGGETSLVTPTAPAPCTLLPSVRCDPVFRGVSEDGRRAWFESDERLLDPDERLLDPDEDDVTDVYESRLVVPAHVQTTSEKLELRHEDAPAAVDPAVAIDAPYGELFGATVTIAGGFDAATDELRLPATLPAGISAAPTPGGDGITLTGRADAADYQDVLRAITYDNTATGDSPGDRGVAFAVDGGGGLGPAGTRSLAIDTPHEDGTGAPAGPAVPEPSGPAASGGGGTPAAPLRIADTGTALAHVRRPGFFRVPGLVFACPRSAESACRATVAVTGSVAAESSVSVPPGETRGVRIRLSAGQVRLVRRRGEVRLSARVTYSGAGTSTAAAKRFALRMAGG